MQFWRNCTLTRLISSTDLQNEAGMLPSHPDLHKIKQFFTDCMIEIQISGDFQICAEIQTYSDCHSWIEFRMALKLLFFITNLQCKINDANYNNN